MGNALEGFSEAPCCSAAGAGNAPPQSSAGSGPHHHQQQRLTDEAQHIKRLMVEAQACLHPSETRVSALFDLYDTDQNGYLDPAELKEVMLDVYKSAIATLTERAATAAEQAAAACAAVTDVDRRWMEAEQRGWAPDAPERGVLVDERSVTTRRERLAGWNEANVKNCLAELNRHFVYIRSDPRPEAVLELITALDQDNDGQISKSEFLSGFCQHMKDSFATLDDAEIDAELAKQEDLLPAGGGGGGAGEDGERSAGEEALRSLLTEEEWI